MVRTRKEEDARGPDAEPALILLASPDEYLLELECRDAVTAWVARHPAGETVTLDPAPAPARLVHELINRSLFSPERLIVVPDASPYFVVRGEAKGQDEVLAGALAPLGLADATLLLAAVAKQEPKGPLADVVRARGALRYLPVPAAPKPWEDVRVSGAQRAVLAKVIARVAPAAARQADVVDALCEAYGFHVRELAQAAERLVAAGAVTPQAVRDHAGVGECSLAKLEKALIERDTGAVAQLLGRLAGGGVLVGWWGEAVDAGGVGPVLAGTLARLFRQALAMRAHARRCDLAGELDAGKCAARFWYKNRYWNSESKSGIHAAIADDAAATIDSPLAGMAPWQAHRTFRLAAAYDDSELIDALAALSTSGIERAPAHEVVPALTSLLLTLTSPREEARPSA